MEIYWKLKDPAYYVYPYFQVSTMNKTYRRNRELRGVIFSSSFSLSRQRVASWQGQDREFKLCNVYLSSFISNAAACDKATAVREIMIHFTNSSGYEPATLSDRSIVKDEEFFLVMLPTTHQPVINWW